VTQPRAHHRPAPKASPEPIESRDPLGRMALYSEPEPGPEPRAGGLVLECSSCLAETPVSLAGLIRSALPMSIHLPMVRQYPSLMRCPACTRRTWLRLKRSP
jgi:hypothetical protein